MKTKRDNLERKKIDEKSDDRFYFLFFIGACVVNDFGA